MISHLNCIYIFIPLLFFGCIGCRIDCRSLSYCSLNHWLRGIRFAVKVSRLSLSRKICKGVLSVANHRLCSEENSRPVKFTILPLISSANSIAERPICLARRSNLRRLAKSGYQRWAVLIIELRMLVSSLCSASFASRALRCSLSLFIIALLCSTCICLILVCSCSIVSSRIAISSRKSSFLRSNDFILPLPKREL